MQINGTLINLYHVCKRQMWLHAHGIRMEHSSQVVAEGKLIAETTYLDRARKYTELELDGIKIDYYDAKNKVIHEVKKSDKVEHAHFAQVKYYLYILIKNGIDNPSAILEYPKMKQRQIVDWDQGDMAEVEKWKAECSAIIHHDVCPPLLKKLICKKCSYHDFCYAGEDSEV